MLRCKELAHHHASDYLDRQMPFGRRLSMSVHLALCAHCRRFMKQLTVVRALLQGGSRLPADEKTAVEEQVLASELQALHLEQKKSSPDL